MSATSGAYETLSQKLHQHSTRSLPQCEGAPWRAHHVALVLFISLSTSTQGKLKAKLILSCHRCTTSRTPTIAPKRRFAGFRSGRMRHVFYCLAQVATSASEGGLTSRPASCELYKGLTILALRSRKEPEAPWLAEAKLRASCPAS